MTCGGFTRPIGSALVSISISWTAVRWPSSGHIGRAHVPLEDRRWPGYYGRLMETLPLTWLKCRLYLRYSSTQYWFDGMGQVEVDRMPEWSWFSGLQLCWKAQVAMLDSSAGGASQRRWRNYFDNYNFYFVISFKVHLGFRNADCSFPNVYLL